MALLVHIAMMKFALDLLVIVPSLVLSKETDRTAIVVNRQYSSRLSKQILHVSFDQSQFFI
jgi:hypothetical protein